MLPGSLETIRRGDYNPCQSVAHMCCTLAPLKRLCTPGGYCDDLGARLQGQLPHPDEVLRDLGQPLLVLVHKKLGPVRQVFIHLYCAQFPL